MTMSEGLHVKATDRTCVRRTTVDAIGRRHVIRSRLTRRPHIGSRCIVRPATSNR